MSLGDSRIAGVTNEESVRAFAGPGNVVGAQAQSRRSEIDWLRSFEKARESPIGTFLGVLSGGNPFLQERVDTANVLLDDKSIKKLVKLAQDEPKWAYWQRGNLQTQLDWKELGKKLRNAKEDGDQIAKALAVFGEGTGDRRWILQGAAGSTGHVFEFPDELIKLQSIYDALVVNDPRSSLRALVNDGRTAEALIELKKDEAMLASLANKIAEQQDKLSMASLAEMLRRTIDRYTELRAEIQKLSPSMPQEAMLPEGATTIPGLADQVRQYERERSLISTCKMLRRKEQAIFETINDRLKNANVKNIVFMSGKFNELRAGYAQWDMLLQKLKAIYVERGENPERANQFAPDRAQWKALYSKAFP